MFDSKITYTKMGVCNEFRKPINYANAVEIAIPSKLIGEYLIFSEGKPEIVYRHREILESNIGEPPYGIEIFLTKQTDGLYIKTEKDGILFPKEITYIRVHKKVNPRTLSSYLRRSRIHKSQIKKALKKFRDFRKKTMPEKNIDFGEERNTLSKLL